jgi:flagellum-specific ATP synthase
LKLPTENILNEIDRLPEKSVYGRVTGIVGLMVEVEGVVGELSIGERCNLIGRSDRCVMCEVVGFKNERALLMPFGTLDGIGLGSRAEVSVSDPLIYPDLSWVGRVVNAFGEPVDGKGPLVKGAQAYRVHSKPPHAHERQRVGGKIDLGIRALNAFLTCCRGQRMGVFSGSGVGKSTVMSMMARHTDAEISVIGLIGERGREAREFIEDDLGEGGMARSVVIVATSDEPPLVRRQAAYVQMAISEFFRDQNKDVLCLMDSVTRFAMAQREISLSAGEPPASKGYTPSVFAELPRLLERAGPGTAGQGSITGLFTVLVEGDDHNEPVADAVRGILDGHIVLDRAIAERGRFPAINILRSVSRTMPDCNSPEENEVVNIARKYMATYEDMAELIRLGAYRRGSDGAVDEAIDFYPGIEKFLAQNIDETSPLETCYEQLRTILGMSTEGAANTRDAPMPIQSKLIEPQPQETEPPIQNSESVKETDQPINEQAHSLDTLSELNSLGGQ